MWTAVYMIEGLDAAEKLGNKLQDEGFLVKIKPFAKEGEVTIYQILAPEFEASDIQKVILEMNY